MTQMQEELSRFFEGGRYRVMKYQRRTPGGVQALIVRMQGEPLDGRERFWVRATDPDDQTFLWENMNKAE